MLSNFSSLRWGLLLALFVAVTGCTNRSTSRFVTPQASARTALESALDAWQNGQPPGAVSTSPPVQAVDSTWRAGQKLSSYEILQEEPGDGARVFAVRLYFASSSKPLEVRYYVVGRDPIVVYRDADYDLPAGM